MSLFCVEVLEGLKSLEKSSIDCIVTSPPYWKNFEYESYFNSYKQYLDWVLEWLKDSKRVLKENGSFWLNISNDVETTSKFLEFMEIIYKLQWKIHDTIIWYRYNSQPSNSDRQLTNQYEFIFLLRHNSNNVILNKKLAYKMNPLIFKTKNVGNVWEIPFNSGIKANKGEFGKKETKSKWGHSGFPLELPETCILLSTKENDLVLDMFIGSGQTAIAAKKYNRKYIGFDKYNAYIELSRKRIDDFKRKKNIEEFL